MQPYNISCMQTIIRCVEKAKDSKEARKIRLENVKRFCELIEGARYFAGGSKIYLFPEFSISGVPWTESVAEAIERYAIYMPGEELDLLSETAKKFKCYIGGNNWEKNDDWPGRFFNSSYLISPEGKLLGTYWRNHTGFGNNPHDFLDAFIKKHGWDKLFPVYDTPLGRIGMFPCQEAATPEIARMYAFKGVELILHPHGGGGTRYPPPKDLGGPLALLVARARENFCYIASAGQGGYLNSKQPTDRSVGYSHIVGPGGRLLAKSDGHGECTISAQVDIERLREAKRRTGMPLANVKTELYVKAYQQIFYPANQFLDTPMEHRSEMGERRKRVIPDLIKRGLIL
jgi:predicted amidohydrolase